MVQVDNHYFWTELNKPEEVMPSCLLTYVFIYDEGLALLLLMAACFCFVNMGVAVSREVICPVCHVPC